MMGDDDARENYGGKLLNVVEESLKLGCPDLSQVAEPYSPIRARGGPGLLKEFRPPPIYLS